MAFTFIIYNFIKSRGCSFILAGVFELKLITKNIFLLARDDFVKIMVFDQCRLLAATIGNIIT